MKPLSRPCLLGLAFSLLAVAPLYAADLLSGSSWALLSPKGDGSLQATGQTLRVTVRHPLTAYYQIELTHDVAAALPAGTSVRCHFLARSVTGSPIHAVIEKRTAPYTRVLDKAITLTPTWKAYTFAARVPVAYGPRGLAARLQLGQKAGVFEFKGLSVTKG